MCCRTGDPRQTVVSDLFRVILCLVVPRFEHSTYWVCAEQVNHWAIAAFHRVKTKKKIFYLSLDKSSLVRIFQNQILTLSVTGKEGNHDEFIMNMRANLFTYILTMFTNLLHLKFYQNLNNPTGFVLFNDQCSMFSSTLLELHINVYYFDDCLYLLDGRFNQLRILFVNVFHIFPLRPTISNKVSYISKKNNDSYC